MQDPVFLLLEAVLADQTIVLTVAFKPFSGFMVDFAAVTPVMDFHMVDSDVFLVQQKFRADKAGVVGR